jgi:signal transduction histidine kinase
MRRALAGVVKLTLNGRLLALLLTVLWLPTTDPDLLRVATTLLAIVGITSLAPILLWERLGGWLLEHPAWTLVDVLAAVAVLALLGLETPFVLFVLTTALVSGVLYGWLGAAMMSVALIGAYAAAAMLGAESPTLAEVLGTPALVPVAALGGAGIRELLVRQHAATRALAEAAMSEAAGGERTRLAREMHDTLAKTLHGIGLSASAVAELATQDPGSAAITAARLAETAERAAEEARALIVDLRQDDLERPLADSLRDAVGTWSARTGVQVDVDADPCTGLSPSARYELFCIAREALVNAHEHGGAGRVQLTLRDGLDVELTISDDGTGFVLPSELHQLAEDGHFGVLGMHERAATVGGHTSVVSAPGAGTTVRVVVPATAPGDTPAQLPPPHRSLEPEGGA